MSESEAAQGEAVPGEQEEQDFETPVGVAGPPTRVDEPPALIGEGDSPGEIAEALTSDLMEDAVAWGLPPVMAASVSGASKVARAGIWRRAAAAVLDGGVNLAAAGAALLVSELLWLRSDGAVSVPVWVPALVFVAAGWAHTLAGEGAFGGATLGKRALGLRVVGGGGFDPALWRVVARRACLDAVVLVVAALALWLTMVRQYGGLPPGTPVELDGSDAMVFCAFFANLVVLLALGRRLDPKRRFPHDSLAGLAVICTAETADAGGGTGSGGRLVAAPVGVVKSRWNDETAEVAPARPWDGRRWRPDPAAAKAVERERERMGPVSRLIERVVAWGQVTTQEPAGKAAEQGAKEAARSSGGGRRVGLVNRLADRVVAWSEGESRASSGGAEKDSAG